MRHERRHNIQCLLAKNFPVQQSHASCTFLPSLFPLISQVHHWGSGSGSALSIFGEMSAFFALHFRVGSKRSQVRRLGPNPGKRDFCLREWKEEERSLKSFAKGVVVAVAATRMRLAVRGLSRHQQMNKRASLTPYQGGFYV